MMLACKECGKNFLFINVLNTACPDPWCLGVLSERVPSYSGLIEYVFPHKTIEYFVHSVTWTGDVAAVAAALYFQAELNVSLGVIIVTDKKNSYDAQVLRSFYQDIERQIALDDSAILICVIPDDFVISNVARGLSNRRSSIEDNRRILEALASKNIEIFNNKNVVTKFNGFIPVKYQPYMIL